jgi:hypothetical protein
MKNVYYCCDIYDSGNGNYIIANDVDEAIFEISLYLFMTDEKDLRAIKIGEVEDNCVEGLCYDEFYLLKADIIDVYHGECIYCNLWGNIRKRNGEIGCGECLDKIEGIIKKKLYLGYDKNKMFECIYVVAENYNDAKKYVCSEFFDSNYDDLRIFKANGKVNDLDNGIVKDWKILLEMDIIDNYIGSCPICESMDLIEKWDGLIGCITCLENKDII